MNRYCYHLVRHTFPVALLLSLAGIYMPSAVTLAETTSKISSSSEADLYFRALNAGCKATSETKDVSDSLIDIACKKELSGNTKASSQILKQTLLVAQEKWPNDKVSIGRIASVLALIESLHGNNAAAEKYRSQAQLAYKANFGLPDTELTAPLTRLMCWGYFGPITYEEWSANSEALKQLLLQRFTQLQQTPSIAQAELSELVPMALAINTAKNQLPNKELNDKVAAVLNKVSDTKKPNLANEFYSALIIAQSGDSTKANQMLSGEANAISSKSAAKEHIDWAAMPELPPDWAKGAKKVEIDKVLAKAPDMFGAKDVCLFPLFVSEGVVSPNNDAQQVAFEKALSIAGNWIDPTEDSIETARGLLVLAWLYDHAHQYNKAAASVKQALPIYEKTYGPDSLQVASVLTCYANENANLKNYSLADESVNHAIAILTKIASQTGSYLTPPVTGVPILSDVAAYYERIGQPVKASETANKLLAIAKDGPTKTIAVAASAIIPYGGIPQLSTHSSQSSIEELENAAALADKLLQEDPSSSSSRSEWNSAKVTLANAYTKAHQFSKADGLYQQIFHRMDEWYGPDSKASVPALAGYLELLKVTGKNAEADEVNSKLVKIIEGTTKK